MGFNLKEIEKSGFDIKKIVWPANCYLHLYIRHTFLQLYKSHFSFFNFQFFLELIPVYMFCWKLNIFLLNSV